MTKKYFKEVNTKVNFPELEENILKVWDKENVFEKSLEKNKGKKNFVFYEGPPTANGKPGIHHVESRSFKDIIPRYKTMRGFNVPRKAGWDCHGLPVELQVEKALNISGKPQIEEYGIEEFCKLCRDSVHEYVDDWSKLTKRMGYWVDLDNPYETMDNNYIESEWWILKEIYNKGWLYEDYKVVPYCPRCGTSLSSHELALGYKDDVEDPSIFVKFKVKNEVNTYFLAWTTTPWTLPGNVALAVSAKETYVKIKVHQDDPVNEEFLILSEKRAKDLDIKGKVIERYKGKDLEKTQYEPLYNFVSYDSEAHFVVLADFVSMDEGTGIVHTAVMYGEDDFNLAQKYGLPKKHVVNEKGQFISDVKPWEGRFVKSVDKEIIEELVSRNLIFKSERIKHTYPFCWRCGTPLLYYAMTSWYLKTTAVKKELIKNNGSVNWVPEHIKEGRMGEWLKNNHDWALSRSRYWGTPLPIWRCEECKETEIIGSVKELSERSGKNLSKLDLHRPFIDEITFKCKKCSGVMRRVNFVLDCWFDSGAMPMAQWHYPFENSDKFKENFPADYISEAIDQTRGWFYTLQGVSALLEKGTAYKNVICLGHVLDEKGNKMSKSKGNIIDPWEVMNEVGADATRWYFFSVIAPGPSFKFSTNLVKDVTKRFLLILWNTYNYFVTYSNLNGWEPKGKKSESKNILDKWITIKLQDVVNKVTEDLDSYDLYNATHLIEDFVSKDFSQWYIRRSRGRTDDGFFETSLHVLTTVCTLIAPFAPFIADDMYRNLTREVSVHLADWPKEMKLTEEENKIIKEMDEVRKVAEKTHSLRKENGIALRQPLGALSTKFKFSEEFKAVLMDEVNVKNVMVGKDEVKLDTKLTPLLIAEGQMRDLVRKIQEERKNLGTKLDEKVNVTLPDWPIEFEDEIKKRALVAVITKGVFKVERQS